MKDFIKQQQELARKELGEPAEGYSHYNVDGCTVERLITQIITNTGAELMQFIEKQPLVFDANKTEDEYIKKDTLKKHITSVTGVE